MSIKQIKSEKDYQKALERLEIIFSAGKGSKEGKELEAVGLLIWKYEEKHHAFECQKKRE